MAEIILDSARFIHNLDCIAHHIKSRQKLALVLKDNAYGHGLVEIAQMAKTYGICNVFVKSYAEALKIKDLFSSISVLYGGVPDSCPDNIYCSIASLSQLQSLHSHCNIELKVNIGMNRNGIELSELDSALRIIIERSLRLVGVFGHNGYGDNDDETFFTSQSTFSHIKQKVSTFCATHNLSQPRFHSLSTSGTLRSKHITDDLVRIGIGAYGYHTSEIPLDVEFKPIASLWADRISSQHLKKGDKIGYGGVSVVQKEGIFSTYDVGYGDGLPRLARGFGKLFCASGEEILPIMSMDCFSCESQKDRICVFDDVTGFARVFRTIPYVILTHLSPFLKRVVI
ncbi:alanine racemase [Helicobacter fennelliae]|uniref:Alanine racemase n=2 Tax=Helicobacter fennelliae TaxID=215 RepID=T1DWA9_9HELI|nr:alanine racemase [Helicobacter fennelliae]GAD19448.1 alanine racemase [Helicobacter fennelliae MRY12-0050]SQB97562.1 alanine racemase [Helicobacter fennelliae]STP06962.1 alanine racemase [Helicobacter fennelliae]STQ83491.1 alanine racemase [Helicobacter fennelliae]